MGARILIIKLNEAEINVLKELFKTYLKDPLTHAYLVYDIIYYLDNIDLIIKLDAGIRGYALAWYGATSTDPISIILWSCDPELIRELNLPRKRGLYVQLYCSDEEFMNKTRSMLRDMGYREIEVMEMLDMVVDKQGFRDYKKNVEGNLKLLDEGDVGLLRDFLVKTGAANKDDAEEKARVFIKRNRYYALMLNGEIASIAGCYVRLNEVWVIGGVFTLPEYRGRGFAKIVTAAITREAVSVGAKALLHVLRSNKPAIRVYEALGYRVLRERFWLKCHS